jgi:hypothetical protein
VLKRTLQNFRNIWSEQVNKTLLSSAMFILLWVQQTFACSPPQTPQTYSMSRLVTAATFVVEATRDSRTEAVYDSTTRENYYRFTVHRWHKGNGPDAIQVGGFGTGPDCRSPVPQGRAILFLMQKVENGRYSLNYIGPHTGAREASEQNLLELNQVMTNRGQATHLQ